MKSSYWPRAVPKNRMDCVNKDGEFDADLLEMFRRQKKKEMEVDFLNELLEMEMEDDDEEGASAADKDGTTTTSGRKRQRQRVPLPPGSRRSNFGVAGGGGPRDTNWYKHYVASPRVGNAKFERKFRRRFRLPHDKFVLLTNEAKESNLFKSWNDGRKDATGRLSTPIEILILGALRYIGRGCTMDCIEESTAVSEETFRRFFHCYIEWGSTVLYDKYVVHPTNANEAGTHMKEFEEAGFSGAVGSTDATHVGMLRCCYTLKQFNNGFKLNMPARTYNVTSNHRRRILSSTRGHPSRYNDKTLVLYDSFVSGLKEGELLSDLEFELLQYDRRSPGRIVSRRYKGGWVLVDNGYLKWPCTIPPYKNPETYAEKQWSKWAESLRKDVECTFGILKTRFKLLKDGVRLHGVKATDKIWLTCCALHNFLLEADGLDEEWDQNILAAYNETDDEEETADTFLESAGETTSDTTMDDQNCVTESSRSETVTMGRTSVATRQTSAGDTVGSESGQGFLGRPSYGGVEEEEEPEPDLPQPVPVQDELLEVHDDEDGDNVSFLEGVDGRVENGCAQVREVWKLDQEFFRQRLVEHFSILWDQRKIKWPSRTGLHVPLNVRMPADWTPQNEEE